MIFLKWMLYKEDYIISTVSTKNGGYNITAIFFFYNWLFELIVRHRSKSSILLLLFFFHTYIHMYMCACVYISIYICIKLFLLKLFYSNYMKDLTKNYAQIFPNCIFNKVRLRKTIWFNIVNVKAELISNASLNC